MRCTENSGFFPPRGKRSAIVRRYYALAFLFLCAVFSCFHTTGCEVYSFTTVGYGICNVRTRVFGLEFRRSIHRVTPPVKQPN